MSREAKANDPADEGNIKKIDMAVNIMTVKIMNVKNMAEWPKNRQFLSAIILT